MVLAYESTMSEPDCGREFAFMACRTQKDSRLEFRSCHATV